MKNSPLADKETYSMLTDEMNVGGKYYKTDEARIS